ncbi:Dihydroxy-acid dehydratase [Pseudobythopirellula maris]|uniref:Dihydroxy-acid dehydratase n=1 Tax=Pseudobythopirellula maris TaxID=2527991 RepID=A0A5C5ZRS3_9BACT|nr:YjhG/YagF family D-xylonate dehydratase [Pseudobythopirellula maris]TWT90214.1 Dihydroxy-acid dehydratase [Pseudobythopirellula maris]
MAAKQPTLAQDDWFPSGPELTAVVTSAKGPAGSLPLTDSALRSRPSGDLFGWTQDAAMGWNPAELGRDEYLVLSTQGGLRAPDGEPIALGYHTGHWEVGLLVEAAAREIRAGGGIPFAAACSDPCDGRSQGTRGMYDSLAYRNDAAIVLRRLIRSLPTRKGVIGVATCDKGHPAMLMALAGSPDLPGVVVPGGVTLPPVSGEDAGRIQTIGARYSHGELTLREAAELGCRACATPGGGCQFLGTAATSQVIGEALGLSLPHSALAPSGQPVWLELARGSARAVANQRAAGLTTADMVTEESIRNAMVVHAAFGGSTNLLLHVPAIAHAAGLRRPTVDDWAEINRTTPRLVSVLPNGPADHPTVRVFLAGGVPEVMLHLRRLGLLNTSTKTALAEPLDKVLDAWEKSDRRWRVREQLRQSDGVDPDDVIYSPERAAEQGLTGTLAFPTGNVAPDGAVVKATSIDRSLFREGVYRHTGAARVFTSEAAAMAAIKSPEEHGLSPGNVIVLAGAGPIGTGMEETYQLTSALKHLAWGKQVPLITDARFSGVSTGACIGHIGPEGLAGGPIGKLLDGDQIEITIDPAQASGSVNLIGDTHGTRDQAWGAEELDRRPSRDDLAEAEGLHDDTRLWAALQTLSGGAWGGCVYDAKMIRDAVRRNE